VIRGEGSNFKLVGDLTIKDVTREVTFDGEFRGVITDPWGNTRAGFSAEATIDRKDYNITWNKVLDTGGLTVGNKVDIKIEVEAIKQ
jgi:polyisoprenoid-binding protein YceI